MTLFCREPTKLLLQNLRKHIYYKTSHQSSTMLDSVGTTCVTALNRTFWTRTGKTQVKQEEEDDDGSKPVKFTSSRAAEWRAEYSRMGGIDDKPPSQPIIVSLSVAVFLLYFLVFREENDIDIKLGGGDSSSIGSKYLEFINLKTIVESNIASGKENDPKILDRLEELKTEYSKIN